MAIFAQDSFTDTDATNLNAHTGEIGATWAKLTGFSGNATIDGNALINGTSEAAYYASGSPSGPDYEVSADCSWENSIYGNLKIMGRADTGTGDHYTLHYARSDAVFRLQKYVSGSLTTLASSSQSLVNESTYRTHKLQLSGSNLEGFVNGVSVVSTTDATITAAGKAGLRLSGNTNTRWRIDNFLAEDASGGGGQTLTQSSTFTNTNTFYTHTVDVGSVTIAQSSRFDNTNTFYTHTITAGAVTLSQSSRFDNTNTFYTHVVSTDAVTITQSSRFDNTNIFYTHSISVGTVTVTQSSRFDNTNTFYTHSVDHAGQISQDARFDNTNTFYTHTVSAGAVTATQSSRYDNTNTFYTHSVAATYSIPQATLFTNTNTFYIHTVTVGTVTLTQSNRFDNTNTFYTHALTGDGETITQSATYENTTIFYTHTKKPTYSRVRYNPTALPRLRS